ncbi:MAG: hypothetical protein KW788_00310 [Candidatus Doudnabacteria bacterium]|nr:hypothetical protein [Candidatus Doudnabacteria bacterium]
MKKWLLALAILVVLLVGAYFYVKSNQTLTINEENPGGDTKVVPKVSLFSANGTVKQINGKTYSITLADGSTVKDFTFGSTLEVVRRVTAKTGTALQSAKLSDVAVGSQIVIYSSNDLASSTAVVSKVEIIK